MINLIWSGCLLLLLSGCGWDGTPTRKNDFVPLTSIKISAELPAIEASRTIAAQTSTKLKATGNFSGLFTQDVTDQVAWSGDSVASFPFLTGPNKNRVKGGVAGGTATITAKAGGVSATYTLTVSSAKIDTLTITPDASLLASLPKGRTIQFAASGKFTDSTTQDLTFDAAWTSINNLVATVSDVDSNRGLAKAVAAAGTATISAAFGSAPTVTASTTLTVTDPVVESIALSPANPSILTLSTKKITATGTYSDGSTPDITSQVAWSSSDANIATIIGDGTVTALTQGTTTIKATLGSVSQSTSLKATGGNLNQITVTPATFALVKDISSPISAKGTFSNGSVRDITGAVQWSVANASVTSAGGVLALLNPSAVTLVPATITATAGSKTGTATLTVIAPQLSSIAFSSLSLDLTAGTSGPLAVIATFNDNTSQDVTSLSVWTSNNPLIASVAPGGLGSERITGGAAGITTISATYGGKTVTTPATVTVRSRTLQSLTISPDTFTLSAGNAKAFTATAIYGDGTTVDVTNDSGDSGTNWTIDNPNVATLVDKLNLPGQVIAVDSGFSATLTASFGGKTTTAKITTVP